LGLSGGDEGGTHAVLKPRFNKLAMDGKKVALVVGGSRGIGRQIAIDLAKNRYAGTEQLYHLI
jgi:hypothetical protein